MLATAPAPVTLRAPSPSDIPAIGRIVYEAFAAINAKHNFPPDFPSVEVATGLIGGMFEVPTLEGIVAEKDGQSVGSAFLWPDGPIGGIGPVTVDPSAQDAGVGKEMMRWIVDRADAMGLEGIRLVQVAFHSRSLALYTKLGFDVMEPLSLIQGEPKKAVIPGREVRPMTGPDMPEANALCEKIYGHARAGELFGAVMQGKATAVFTQGRMTGYATTIGFMGHALGETNDDLKALISAADEISGPGILLPTRNAELMRWCLAQGFRIGYPGSLMSRGRYQEPKGAFLPSVLY